MYNFNDSSNIILPINDTKRTTLVHNIVVYLSLSPWRLRQMSLLS